MCLVEHPELHHAALDASLQSRLADAEAAAGFCGDKGLQSCHMALAVFVVQFYSLHTVTTQSRLAESMGL